MRAEAGPGAVKETESWISAAQALEAKFAEDPHRPQWHFLPPAAWMNDINGAIFWRGRYHIFYQYNPDGAYWKRIQWGHASSPDLVHWTHHPVALKPVTGGADRDGCFSGGAFLSKEGVPTFIYHGVPDGTCIASSTDDLLLNWTLHPANPVIRVPQPGKAGFGQYTVYDPCAWLEGDVYCALIGNTVPGLEEWRDATSLFKSKDLVHWEYSGPFYQRREEGWTEAGEDCAVPDFFPLGDRHMLLFNSHLHGTQYYLGHFDGRRFEPEVHGRMSWPGGQLGGARTLLDAQGRRIFFDWVRELRGADRERASGWSGTMTVPRVLSLAPDGTLRIEPVPELQLLRVGTPLRQSDIALTPGAEFILDGLAGDCLELRVEIEAQGAVEFGLSLRRSPDGAEKTSVVAVPGKKCLKVDVSHSSLDKSIKYFHYRNDQPRKKPVFEVESQDAPFELAAGEPLHLHLYLDRSILEVFANGRQCITQRLYPTRADSLGVSLFTRGGNALARSVQAWRLAPAH